MSGLGREELRRSADRAYTRMMADRLDYEEGWRAMRHLFSPSRGRFTEGDKPSRLRDRRNSRPRQIVDEFAAGMRGASTNPATPWFALALYDNRDQTSEPVKVWLSECNDIMLAQMARTNMYDQLTEFCKELAVFGTAVMVIDEDDESVFHCRTLTVGEYALASDAKRRVDSLGQRLSYTAEQLVDAFGEEKVPIEIRGAAKRQDGTKHEVRHLIMPNPDYTPKAAGQRGMKYCSLWWLAGRSNPDFLRVQGYHEFPVVTCRWSLVADDTYGREHPGEVGLDDAETIQRIETDSRTALELAVRPPLLIEDGAIDSAIDFRPGGLTPYQPLSQKGAPVAVPLFQTHFDFHSAEQKISMLIQSLEKTFFVDLFRLWSNAPHTRQTAAEVHAREQEKMFVLGPLSERLTSEAYDPMITRIFQMMLREEMLPPVPPELSGQSIKIEYTSVLANIQKQYAQAGIDTVLSTVGALMQLQAAGGERPDVIDALDMDEIVQYQAESQNLPEGIVLGDDALAEKRAAKQAAANEQMLAMMMAQMAQQAPNVADAAKTMSETEMGDGSNGLESMMAMTAGGGEM